MFIWQYAFVCYLFSVENSALSDENAIRHASQRFPERHWYVFLHLDLLPNRGCLCVRNMARWNSERLGNLQRLLDFIGKFFERKVASDREQRLGHQNCMIFQKILFFIRSVICVCEFFWWYSYIVMRFLVTHVENKNSRVCHLYSTCRIKIRWHYRSNYHWISSVTFLTFTDPVSIRYFLEINCRLFINIQGP